MKKTVGLVGVQMDFGASKRGVSMGAMAIRYAGLSNGLSSIGYSVHDHGDLIPLGIGMSKNSLRNYEQVVDVERKLYDLVSTLLKDGEFPVILGGDHSISSGSISAVAKHYEAEGPIGVIWLDAHGDWNDEDSSPSGNMHGMSFSSICGYGPNCMVDFGQKPAYVPVKHCVQIGGRDFDPKERTRMKNAGVTVFSIHDIDRSGMGLVIQRAIEIAGKGTAGIHLSFDIDVITPEAAPGTGTQVHSGLTVREAFLAVESLAASGLLLGMDMVEVNPILDERNKTGLLASELIQSALGKAVF